jgi:hypothetical protein
MMMITNSQATESFEILIGELMADDELRAAFLRDPDHTLRVAGDWALPLCDSELQALRTPAYPVWDRVAEELAARLTAAAYARAS